MWDMGPILPRVARPPLFQHPFSSIRTNFSRLRGLANSTLLNAALTSSHQIQYIWYTLNAYNSDLLSCGYSYFWVAMSATSAPRRQWKISFNFISVFIQFAWIWLGAVKSYQNFGGYIARVAGTGHWVTGYGIWMSMPMPIPMMRMSQWSVASLELDESEPRLKHFAYAN